MSLAMVPVLALLVLAVFLGGHAAAAPHVFFSPGMTLLQPGEDVEISFRVNDCGDSISGYQLYLSFDPEVVELTSATAGSLYLYSGHQNWFIPDELEPGLWKFFDTVMGAGTYILPPGELLHLQFQALDYGTTQLHIDSILLADINRENLPVGSFEHGHIFVVAPTGVGEGGGTARLGPAYPNPFAAGTAVPFSAPMAARRLSAEVYDVEGKLVKRLPLPDGVTEGELTWDGRDERGQVVPSSVYFLRMTTRTGTAHCRLVKVN